MEPPVHFERLNRKLNALESMEVIGADDVFEAISLLLSDIDDIHGKGGIDTYSVEHEDVFVKALLKTINTAMVSYEKNAASLNGMSERRRKSYDIAVAEIQKAEKELAPLIPEIEKLNKTRQTLEDKLAQVRKIKEAAPRLEESIQRLEGEISRLDSISIEELQGKEAKLLQEKNDMQAKLDALNSSIEIAGGELEAIRKAIAEKSDIQKNNEREKEHLETEDKKINLELSDYLDWKDVFISEQKTRLGQMMEARDQLTAIHNAWSAMSQNQELPEVLKVTGKFRINNMATSSVDDIKKWFDDMQTGLQTCIETYAETYKVLLTVMN